MNFKFLKAATVGLVLSVTGFVNAGVIDSSSVLLDEAGASQLENWLGQGDLNWDSVWYGATGATSSSWHSAVDGVSNTVSIYDITYAGQNYLIGGYNANVWSSTSGWASDSDGIWENFIFNLTTNTKAQTADPHANWAVGYLATYNHNNYFAAFGGGFDLWGGTGQIGNGGYAHYVGSYVGEQSTGLGNIVDGQQTLTQYTVNSLETFTFNEATSVPEPTTLAIFALGMIGLASRRFKKQS